MTSNSKNKNFLHRLLQKTNISTRPRNKYRRAYSTWGSTSKVFRNDIRQQTKKDLKLLKIISKMNWVMLRIFRSHIRTKLDYGSFIYSATRKSYFKKLQTIHNQGLRLSFGAFQTSITKNLYIEADEPPLTLRWEKWSLQYTLKLQSSANNPTHQKANNSQFNHFHSSKPLATSPFGLRIKEAIQHINQNANNISPLTMSNLLPWTITKHHIDF